MMGVDTSKIKLSQKTLCGIIIGLIFIILFGLFFGFFTTVKSVFGERPVLSNIENAKAKVGEQALWNYKVESDNKKLELKIDALTDLVSKGEERIANQAHQMNKMKAELQKSNSAKDPNAEVMAKLQALQGKVASFDSGQASAPSHQSKPSNKVAETQAEFRPVYDNEEELTTVSLNVADDKYNTPENTIPAGSFAKAILLSGVEAPTAVKSAVNPVPVFLQIVGKASLPNGFKVGIEGCRLTAAATGNISSERVELKLSRLTCIDPVTQKITEISVQGDVTGEDGRVGIRGTVVIRNGWLMTNAAAAGVLSGVSKAISQMANPVSSFNIPFTGNVNKRQNSMSFLTQSGGEGSSAAAEIMVSYYKERAERRHPVIQVSSGRTVDVIFNKGFRWKDLEAAPPIDVASHRQGRKHKNINVVGQARRAAFKDASSYANEIVEGGL